MPAKITGQNLTQYANVSRTVATHVLHGNDDNTHKKSSQSNAAISDGALFLYKLEQQIAAQPIVDKNRVDDIKMKIKAGVFTTNYLSVADRLIATEKDIH